MLSHIQEELKAIDFDQPKLRVFLEGGEKAYERKRSLQNAIISHPELRKTPAFFSMDREEQMNDQYKRCAIIFKEILPRFGGTGVSLTDLKNIIATQEGQFPIALTFGMFLVQIEALGSD